MRSHFDAGALIMTRETVVIITKTIVLISLPIIMSEKYSFYFFDNFEMTKDCFIKEQNIVKGLRLSRETLHYNVHKLNRVIYNYYNLSSIMACNTQRTHNKNLKKELHFTLTLLYRRYNFGKITVWSNIHHLYLKMKDILNFSFNFERVYKRSTLDIVNGALKGLVMLQETYEQDIIDFSKGQL